MSLSVTLNSSLNYAGQIRAKECAVSFSHTRPDGTSCFTVGTEAGCSIYGENIAAGYWSAEAVVTGWVNSPGHYANMVNPVFTSMGVGTYYDSSSEYGIYWTQLFN
jgi:uncharacterized protein YkwD